MGNLDYCGMCGPKHRTRPETNLCERHGKPIKGLPEKPDTSKAIIKVELRDKDFEQYLPCGCLVEYEPQGEGVEVTINWCDLHERAAEIDGRREDAENDLEEEKVARQEAVEDREEMLERLGMTEVEWACRRPFVPSYRQTTLALVQPIAAKRGRGRIKKA